MDFLTRILESKRDEVAATKARVSLDEVKRLASGRDAPRGFCAALAHDGLRIIAEIKRASPSKGAIDPGLDPAERARAYEAGGAACLSVLTEPSFFLGSKADYLMARRAVSIPVLRKDFIFDEYQVYESAAWGADAILLIVRCVSDEAAVRLLRLAFSLRLDVLLECYDERDVERVPGILRQLAPDVVRSHLAIGINNRDLSSFRTDVTHAAKVARKLPPDLPVVALSGIFGKGDLQASRDAGIRRFLVGEALVRSRDATRTLRSWLEPGARSVKVCGLRDAEMTRLCASLGAGAVGAVFYPPSPRYVTPEAAREIFRELPPQVARVGVFVDLPVEEVLSVARIAGLTTVQLHGRETVEDCLAIQSAGYRVIRAVKDLESACATPETIGVLLECSRGELPGGNGAAWNWREAKTLVPRPFAIAGGLTPETVVEAASVSGACAVDVSSGVESAPGVKDAEKIRRLLATADALPSRGFWLGG